MNDPYEAGGVMEELTSEVITPKKRGRPRKVEMPVVETPAPVLEPVHIVVTPRPFGEDPVDANQSMPAQTLAEIEAGRRTLDKYRRG